MPDRSTAPERLDLFMARANAAYYSNLDPFADFTTAPEISQMFGELIGAWCAVAWTAIGAPARVVLAELGPGRGTLMADALRAVRAVAPSFAAACQVVFVETAPRLAAAQARAVPVARIVPTFADLPPGPLLLLANEFFDALPIRQLVWRGQQWRERWVANGAFVERPADHGPPPAAVDGMVTEFGEAAERLVGAIAARLAASSGAALIVDYGPSISTAGDSLQAIRDGRNADPLADPGQADLTAHVDFSALAAAATAAGAVVQGPEAQGKFLLRLGLAQRAQRLAASRPPARGEVLRHQVQRLADPDAMGRLFKVLALRHPATAPLPGFADP